MRATLASKMAAVGQFFTAEVTHLFLIRARAQATRISLRPKHWAAYGIHISIEQHDFCLHQMKN
jgi:hypothetical protein